MRRRTFEEMITYFNQTVSDMDIDRKYKITLLGIVTALLQKHDEDVAQIEPQRKRGKWLFKERRESVYDLSGVKTWGIAYMCSECEFIHTVIEDFGQYVYCPNCGADLREGD